MLPEGVLDLEYLEHQVRTRVKVEAFLDTGLPRPLQVAVGLQQPMEVEVVVEVVVDQVLEMPARLVQLAGLVHRVGLLEQLKFGTLTLLLLT